MYVLLDSTCKCIELTCSALVMRPGTACLRPRHAQLGQIGARIRPWLTTHGCHSLTLNHNVGGPAVVHAPLLIVVSTPWLSPFPRA
jgi:hypothetical protein